MSTLAQTSGNSAVTVVGSGLIAALHVLALLTRHPDLDLRLITNADLTATGVLQPVALSLLPAGYAAMLEPALVRHWDGFTVVRNGNQTRHQGQIALLDPMQLALELDSRLPPTRVHRIDGADEMARLLRGAAEAPESVIPLPPDRPLQTECQIIQSGHLADLDEPVLADFDAAGGPWQYLQYFPLGAGMVLVRKIGLPSAPGGDGQILHDDPPDLTRILEQCSELNRAARQSASILAGRS